MKRLQASWARGAHERLSPEGEAGRANRAGEGSSTQTEFATGYWLTASSARALTGAQPARPGVHLGV